MLNRYLGMFLVITAITVMLFPVSAFAQASRVGSIEGRVDDAEGAVLPGATITLSSANLIGGDKVSVTGADGTYRFPALPPGTYAVAVNMGGFIPQEQAGILVSVSQKLQVIFTMQLGTTDEVTVLGQPPLVDVKNSSVANAVVTADFAQALPSGRSAAGLINYIPGVVGNTDGGPAGGRTLGSGRDHSAFGGTTQGTQFVFDGVAMNSPEGGEVEVKMDFDNLQEASFTGVAGAAEVGGYSGIVVNLISKTGTNELHAAGNFFYRGDEWNSQNSTDPNFRQATSNNKNYHFDLGGPLLRDKLWGYGSVRRETSEEASEDFADQPGFDKNLLYLVKLTAQITEGSKLSAHLNTERDEGQNPGELWIEQAANLPNYNRIRSFNFDYINIFSDNTFLDGKVGGNFAARGDFDREALDLPPARLVMGGGPTGDDILTGSPGFFFDGYRNRYQVNLALTHYADDFLGGSHDFKVGFQGDWTMPKTNIGYTGETNGGAAYFVDFAVGEPAYRYEWQSLEIDPLGQQASFFVQDSWTMANGQLTVNAGLRATDYKGNAKARVGAITNYPSYMADLGDHFHPPISIAPRFGFAYDVFNDGTTAIKGHVGRYFPQMIAGMYAGFQSFSAVEWQFSEWNADLGDYEIQETEFAPAGLEIDPNISMTYFQEVTLGIERQLGSDFSIELSGVVRNTQDFMDKVRMNGEWEAVPVQDAAGNPFIVYNLLNGDEAVYSFMNTEDIEGKSWLGPNIDGFEQTRDFWSLALALEKRFSNNWQMMGSYVYSKNTGTDDTDFENGRGSSLGPSALWTDPNIRFYAAGPLAHDVPHQIKVVGTYVLPYGVNFGWDYLGASGYPYTKQVRFRDGSETTDVELSGRKDRWVEPRSSRRYAWRNNLNLRAEKSFDVGNVRFGVLADLFNVFNSATVRQVITREDANSSWSFGQTRRIKYPRNFRMGIRIDF